MDPLQKLAGLGESADEAGKRHLFVAKSFKKAEDFKKKTSQILPFANSMNASWGEVSTKRTPT